MAKVATRAGLPLWSKLAFTTFMAVLVPSYWHNYGPSNFLYFCDVALFLTLVGMWAESPLLIGMPMVGIFLPQMLWVVDFVSNLFGIPLSGMTDYMFDTRNPLFNRSLSLFHGWLPFLLLWATTRVGYDRRAFLGWIAIAWSLIVVCYAFFPAPPPDPTAPNAPVNINCVHGFDNSQAQDWMPPLAWVALWMVFQPLVLAGPTHLLLRRFAATPEH